MSNNKILTLLTFLILVYISYSHINCGHSKTHKVFGKKLHLDYFSNNFDILQTTYNPIRIFFNTSYLEVGSDPERTCYTVGQQIKRGTPPSISTTCNPSKLESFNCYYTCTSLDIITSPVSTLYKNIVTFLNTTLSNALRVVPVQGQIQSNLTSCGPTSRFGILDVQNSTLKSGISGYDLYIFVTIRPMFTSEEGLSQGTECATDQNGRPIIGHLNIDPASTAPLPTKIAQGYALHEFIHLLGFTFSKFPNYLFQNGTARTNVIQTVAKTWNGQTKNIKYLNLPTAMETVKNHFGCAAVKGVELEELATHESHLEKRIYFNE